MNKFYYIKSCNTCRRILKELKLPKSVELRDIKETPMSNSEIEELKLLSGTYESLFSKRARLYKELGLKEKELTETDYKSYILYHYTFLKRPVITYNGQIFIGNASKTVQAAKSAIHG